MNSEASTYNRAANMYSIYIADLFYRSGRIEALKDNALNETRGGVSSANRNGQHSKRNNKGGLERNGSLRDLEVLRWAAKGRAMHVHGVHDDVISAAAKRCQQQHATLLTGYSNPSKHLSVHLYKNPQVEAMQKDAAKSLEMVRCLKTALVRSGR